MPEYANNDDFGVLVGITNYPGISDLEAPGRDTDDFYDWLTDPDKGSVPPCNVKRITTACFHPPGQQGPQSPDDAEPTASRIKRLFAPLVNKRVNQQQKVGRRLYIYFAGHGFSDETDMNATALFAASHGDSVAEHFPATASAEWFRRNRAFDEVALIMDCCRTVDTLTSMEGDPFPNTSSIGGAHKVRFFYAYGTVWGHPAYERKIDGRVRGVFTKALLDALDNARPNRNGVVTGRQIKGYVKSHIKSVAQDPDYLLPEIDLDDDADIQFFARQRSEQVLHRVAIKLAPFAGGERVALYDEHYDLIEERVADAAALEFELPQGYYSAMVVGTNREEAFEVVGHDVETEI